MSLTDLRRLKSFAVLAEDLNFRETARRLNMSQSALTRQIKQLEEQLGCDLMVRTTRKVELTAAGRAFLVEAKLAVLHGDKAFTFARKAAAGSFGNLSVAYTSFSIGAGVSRILSSFRRRNADIQLITSGMTTDEQQAALNDGRADIAFGMPLSESRTRESVLLGFDRLCLVYSGRPAFADAPEISLRSVHNERFVLGAWSLWRPYRLLINEVCMNLGHFIPDVAQEATETHTVLALVAAGLGVTILPTHVSLAEHLGLFKRPISGDVARLETVATWNKGNKSEVLQTFVRELRRHVASTSRLSSPRTLARQP